MFPHVKSKALGVLLLYKDTTVGYYMFFQKVVGSYFGQFLQYWITINISPLERIVS